MCLEISMLYGVVKCYDPVVFLPANHVSHICVLTYITREMQCA